MLSPKNIPLSMHGIVVPRRICGIQFDDAGGLIVGKRAQHHAVDKTENSGSGSNSDCESRECDCGDSRSFQHHAPGEAEILLDRVEHGASLEYLDAIACTTLQP